MKEIVLASGSPRRKALLEQIGMEFTIDSDIEEVKGIRGLLPAQLAMNISMKKALSVVSRHPDALVIAADTFGVLDDLMMGKPCSIANARKMLASLSGRAHSVITGITVLDTATDKMISRHVETLVYLKELSSAEIESYLKTGEPFDKAGAYGIQGMGAVLVEKIEGDYFNVMGLPLCELADMLKEFGVNVLE